MNWMPPTAIQRWIDGRWKFSRFSNDEWANTHFTSGHCIFLINQEGILQRSPRTEQGYLMNGDDHMLAIAIAMNVSLVRVEFVDGQDIRD